MKMSYSGCCFIYYALLCLNMTSTPRATEAPRRRRRTTYLDGEKLLQHRVDAGLSQREFAGIAGNGVTQSLVSHWERGLHGALLPTVGVLARAFNVPPTHLMPDDLLGRIADGDRTLLRQLAARGVVIEIPGSQGARPVCSACTAPWSDGHKCQKAGNAA